ncbi:MAG: T9SS type A sorting domain-containing protein [Bacteroidota bacterium]|nr:T9SS type A sorting domain-containing protein [Bacteroidota bacterium]
MYLKLILKIRNTALFQAIEKFAGIFLLLIFGMVSINGFSVNLQNNSGFFQLAYNGNGVDHMNINLVNIVSGGLLIGDEIGIFDGEICAGAAVILEKHINDNSIGIPASANDGTENNQNGYIPGHKIIMKLYRDNTVYKLYFQAVNNTNDVFEKWESMFALVDFSKSTGQSPLEFEAGIKIYPNPFTESARIEINLNQEQHLTVEIFNMSGQLIKTLYKGDAERQTTLIWDGKDSAGNKVVSGIYLCRSNQTMVKITFQAY